MGLAGRCAVGPPARRYTQRGWFRTIALDSGVEDCEWHRVQVDADQPPGTSVNMRLATATMPSAVPAEERWQTIPPGTTDALVRQAAGRYLRLELELAGDGRATPVVRGIRLDFDVTTSIDRLPAVYRSEPTAAEFTRHFLSLFDASLGELDEVIAGAPRCSTQRRCLTTSCQRWRHGLASGRIRRGHQIGCGSCWRSGRRSRP